MMMIVCCFAVLMMVIQTVEGQQVECGPGATWLEANNICKCTDPGQDYYNGACNCNVGATVTATSDGKCVCPNGAVYQNGICDCPGDAWFEEFKCKCHANLIFVNEGCGCEPGLVLMNGQCSAGGQSAVANVPQVQATNATGPTNKMINDNKLTTAAPGTQWDPTGLNLDARQLKLIKDCLYQPSDNDANIYVRSVVTVCAHYLNEMPGDVRSIEGVEQMFFGMDVTNAYELEADAKQSNKIPPSKENLSACDAPVSIFMQATSEAIMQTLQRTDIAEADKFNVAFQNRVAYDSADPCIRQLFPDAGPPSIDGSSPQFKLIIDASVNALAAATPATRRLTSRELAYLMASKYSSTGALAGRYNHLYGRYGNTYFLIYNVVSNYFRRYGY